MALIFETIFLFWIVKFGGAKMLQGWIFNLFVNSPKQINWSIEQIKLCTYLIWFFHAIYYSIYYFFYFHHAAKY